MAQRRGKRKGGPTWRRPVLLWRGDAENGLRLGCSRSWRCA